MNWKIYLTSGARKRVKRLPRDVAANIKTEIDRMTSDLFSGDIEKMSGHENGWRKRIGSYRIFYEIRLEVKLIIVFKIERRTSTTY